MALVDTDGPRQFEGDLAPGRDLLAFALDHELRAGYGALRFVLVDRDEPDVRHKRLRVGLDLDTLPLRAGFVHETEHHAARAVDEASLQVSVLEQYHLRALFQRQRGQCGAALVERLEHGVFARRVPVRRVVHVFSAGELRHVHLVDAVTVVVARAELRVFDQIIRRCLHNVQCAQCFFRLARHDAHTHLAQDANECVVLLAKDGRQAIRIRSDGASPRFRFEAKHESLRYGRELEKITGAHDLHPAEGERVPADALGDFIQLVEDRTVQHGYFIDEQRRATAPTRCCLGTVSNASQ